MDTMPDSESSNPYEPPSADLDMPVSGNQVRREGRHLVVPKGWVSPPVCLFTGVTEPLTPHRQANLWWLHPAWLWLLLLTPLPFLLAAILATKTGYVRYVLSEPYVHRLNRREWVIRGVLAVAGLLLLPAFILDDLILLSLPGVILLVVSAFLTATWCRTIKSGKIVGDSIWLTGIPDDVKDTIMVLEQQKLTRQQAEFNAASKSEGRPPATEALRAIGRSFPECHVTRLDGGPAGPDQ